MNTHPSSRGSGHAARVASNEKKCPHEGHGMIALRIGFIGARGRAFVMMWDARPHVAVEATTPRD